MSALYSLYDNLCVVVHVTCRVGVCALWGWMKEGQPRGVAKAASSLLEQESAASTGVLAESKAGRGVGKLQLYPEQRLLACGEVVGRLTGSRACM